MTAFPDAAAPPHLRDSQWATASPFGKACICKCLRAQNGGEAVPHSGTVQRRPHSSIGVHKSLCISILHSNHRPSTESRTVRRNIRLPPILLGGIMAGNAIPEERAKNQAPQSPPRERAVGRVRARHRRDWPLLRWARAVPASRSVWQPTLDPASRDRWAAIRTRYRRVPAGLPSLASTQPCPTSFDIGLSLNPCPRKLGAPHHVATSAIAVAPPVSRGTLGCVWQL